MIDDQSDVKSYYTCQEILAGELMRLMKKMVIDHVDLTPIGSDKSYRFYNSPVELACMQVMVRDKDYDNYYVEFEK